MSLIDAENAVLDQRTAAPCCVVVHGRPAMCSLVEDVLRGRFKVYYSRVAKLDERERLVEIISLSGRERVVDVGCGRGLMVV